MKKLKQALLEANRTIAGLTDNWALQNITEQEMEAIDQAARTDEYVANQRSGALKRLVGLPADHRHQHDNLLELISETLFTLN